MFLIRSTLVAINSSFVFVRDIADKNFATFGQSAKKKIFKYISKGTKYTSIRDT